MATTEFWPNGARLAVTFSAQFEAGGQPIDGAPGPVTDPIAPGFPDLPTNTYFDYGVHEGMPRLLRLFARHGIPFTSFMIGEAVDKAPDLVRAIHAAGHECAAHGRRWSSQYTLPPEEERAWIKASMDSIERVTGARPTGYNCFWMRGSPRTLELLQELGFDYHIDDMSRDEPFIQEIGGKPFVTVPYTVHLNDIASFDFPGFSPAAFEQQLRDEFDLLYEEAAERRRMMVVSLHDRISGHASRVRSLDRFIEYAKGHEGVWFARKDEIARWALQTPDVTPRVEREPAEVSGLPGTSRDGTGVPRAA